VGDESGAYVRHRQHDQLAIAAATDRGAFLGPAFAACPDCATLHGDLRTLLAALASATVPGRPRDYRLTAEDARRLRPSGWRRWWQAVATPLESIGRPVGIALTTLGVVGLLVGTVSSIPGGFVGFGAAGAAAGPTPAEVMARSSADAAAGLAPASAAPSYETLGMEAPSVPIHGVGSVGPMDGPESAPRAGPIVRTSGSEVPVQVPLIALSAAMAGVGVGLLGVGRVVRRRGAMR
jgi:hypothetical protein